MPEGAEVGGNQGAGPASSAPKKGRDMELRTSVSLHIACESESEARRRASLIAEAFDEGVVYTEGDENIGPALHVSTARAGFSFRWPEVTG